MEAPVEHNDHDEGTPFAGLIWLFTLLLRGSDSHRWACHAVVEKTRGEQEREEKQGGEEQEKDPGARRLGHAEAPPPSDTHGAHPLYSSIYVHEMRNGSVYLFT